MKIKICSTLLFVLFATLTLAQEKIYTPESLPKVHLADKRQYVSDPEKILTHSVTTQINALLYQLEEKTGIETVVAVVPSIGEETTFNFTHQLLNSWGVGKKGKDNGLVILLVTGKRRIQFYTGYGLEGVLPDAICKRIQLQHMIPYFKKGDWSNGMLKGVEATYKRVENSMNNEGGENSEDGNFMIIFLAVLGFFGVSFVMSYFKVRKQTKCPQCKHHTLQRSNTQVVSRFNGVKKEHVTYKCQNCGFILLREEQSYDDNNHHNGRGGAGPFIGGFGGGSFGGGGGGFSGGGGSFGGGMGGGGGAGSSF